MIAHLIGMILLYTVHKATAYATSKIMTSADRAIEQVVDKTLDEVKTVAVKTATTVADKTIKYIKREPAKTNMVDVDTQTNDDIENEDYSKHQIDDFIVNFL
jgi:hypothetical protein